MRPWATVLLKPAHDWESEGVWRGKWYGSRKMAGRNKPVINTGSRRCSERVAGGTEALEI